MYFPWFSIFRIKGNSMEPKYESGDFVLLSKSPVTLKNLKVDDDIVFNHAYYGKLLKRINSVQSDNQYTVTGLNPSSISSSKLGPIPKKAIVGKVVFHFTR